MINKILQAEYKYTSQRLYTVHKKLCLINAQIVQYVLVIKHKNINRMKYKNHMIIWIYVEKAYNKMNHAFVIKFQRCEGLERTCLHRRKAGCRKLQPIWFKKGEMIEAVPLMPRMRQGCPLSTLHFPIVL